jgi:crotonobetainyl-CoA:carnitine CoA-transferase CaiB-like acyl-CoA transferase
VKPLFDGVRVLDLTTTFLGPYCTYLLAQQGADVIKVEAPGGDIARRLTRGRSDGMSSIFLSVNHGKRSIALDLRKDGGLAALMDLAQTADVFVHNMRSTAADRLGISAADVRRAAPEIVYCRAQGFGSTGPYAGRPAYDDTIQAISGFADLQGHLAQRPSYVASVIADKTCGIVAAQAITAALFTRERTGVGHDIEIPMFETMSAFALVEHMTGQSFEPPIGPALYGRAISPYRRPYQTADGYVAVMLYTDRHWSAFLQDIGRPDLVDDSRFRDVSGRTANIDEVYAFLDEQFASDTTQGWLARLERLDVPGVPINRTDDLFEDEHLATVGLIQAFEHPSEGRLRQVRSPISVDGAPLPLRERPAPHLGEHGRELLEEIGRSPEEILALQQSGALPG